MRILTDQIKNHEGKEAELAGWLHKRRDLGGLVFLLLRDRAGVAQIVIQDEGETKKLHGLQNGTVISVKGTVESESRAPGGVEVRNPRITIITPVTSVPPIEIDKPIDHKSENLDTLFEHRVLNLRNLTERGIFKIQAAVAESARQYLMKQDFVEFRSPKLLAGATEGGAETFHLDHFGKDATLAQSAQFYKQIMVGVFERVFELGATYRAEPSMTTRHMSEFTTLDVEMGFIESFKDVTKLLSGLINSVVDYAWEHCAQELEALGAIKPKLTDPLPEVTMKELHQLYTKETGHDTTREKDPTPAEERFASDYALEKYGSEAIFITEFPADDMKFYHYRSAINPEVAERADLIFRGVEIVTASQREHRYTKLIEQLQAAGGDPNAPGFKYFLQAFEFGMPPHGGFGLGLERLTQKIIGLSNVKEATLFPRDTNRLAP